MAEAIRLGLEWLKEHQDADGHWSAARFTRHCGEKDFCEGTGKKAHNIGVTALALLCFMGDGSSMRAGPYKEVVRRGIWWLRKQIDKNGVQ